MSGGALASVTKLTKIYTPHIEREVCVREETSDKQVWSDTFTGLYHLPPAEMPVPATLLDLGANIGLTAAHYRYLWPDADILAVEMDEQNHRLAEWNAPDVRHLHAAVGTSYGCGYYDTRAADFAFSLSDLPEALPGFAFVSRLTISDLGESFVSETIDFVKMDIEGEEWNLLASASEWAPLVRHLVVELHERSRAERETMVGAAIGLLDAAGFQARHHPPHPSAVYAWR